MSVKSISNEELQFESFQFGDTPEREFSMARFGLPEFGQTVAQASAPRPIWWWILGAAVGCAAVAIVLRRLAKRPDVGPGPSMG